MKETNSFGLNKTPTQIHPQMTDSMEKAYEEFPLPQQNQTQKKLDEDVGGSSLRAQYIREADSLGSVPVPTSLKGALNTGVQALKGESPATLIDKLGERLAFERSGVRLYDALITKVQAAAPKISLSILYRFREDEEEHYFLVKDCIESIGGDPTAQTPSADAAAVASAGLIQLITEPRSTVQQCVEAQLIAEMTDVVGWDLLIGLAQAADFNDYVGKFKKAKETEDRHTETMKKWLKKMSMENKVVEIPVIPVSEEEDQSSDYVKL